MDVDTLVTPDANHVICSVAALPSSDLAMAGSNYDVIWLWQFKTGKILQDRGLVPRRQIPVCEWFGDWT